MKIILDGRIQSDLDWKEAQKKARECVEQGEKILWELDLGLFSHLQFPLHDQAQFLAVTVALDHFCKTIWEEFQGATEGLLLYRGSIDFSQMLRWDEEQEEQLREWLAESFENVESLNQEFGSTFSDWSQLDHHLVDKRLLRLFCCDVAIHYIHHLVEVVPAAIPIVLSLDVAKIQSPLEVAFLLDEERYKQIQVQVTSSPFPSVEGEETKIGICLPSTVLARRFRYHKLEATMRQLLQENTPFRIISEEFLIAEWDGLDTLIVAPEGISSLGQRKLQGFLAAGGEIIPEI